MKNKKIKNYLNKAVFIITASALLFFGVDYVKTKIQLSELTYEQQELKPCFICGNEVEIKPVNDVFYIECEDFLDNGCGLHTGYYLSKEMLVKAWNKGE